MKRSFKMIALITAICMVVGLAPAVFARSQTTLEKAAEKPLPIKLSSGLVYVGLWGETNDGWCSDDVYLSTGLLAQRMQAPYGKESGYSLWVSGRDWELSISDETRTAYDLTEQDAQEYINGFKAYANDGLRIDVEGELKNFYDVSLLSDQEYSIAYADSITIGPKETEYDECDDYYDYLLPAALENAPRFNFFITDGPAVVDSDYNAASGILYDKKIDAGKAEDLKMHFYAEPLIEWDYDDELEEDVPVYSYYNLLQDAPAMLLIENMETGASDMIDGAMWGDITSLSEKNDKVSITLKKEYINSLEAGTYKINIPFVDGASAYILKVEGECDGTGNCPTAAYNDLDPTQWYHKATDYVLNRGLMVGTSATIFNPTGRTSRAALVMVLWKSVGSPVVEDYEMTFTDVERSDWYGEAVRWAVSEGIVSGYSETQFAPTDPITRQQLALLFCQFEQFTGGDVTVGDGDVLAAFSDADQVAVWAADAMKWAYSEGLISGKGNGTLDPKGYATRVATAQLMMNYLER